MCRSSPSTTARRSTSSRAGRSAASRRKLTATDDWEATADSDVIVITSGAPRKPGMTREDLLKRNAEVVGDYAAKNAAKLSPNAIIIVFANPMDVMCHAAMRASGLPRSEIIGQGGMLDSSRFRTFIAMELGVLAAGRHAYVLGGHTDATMVPIVSQARVGGIPLTEPGVAGAHRRHRQAHDERRRRAGRALQDGIGLPRPVRGTMAMVEAVLLDEKRLMPCAVQLNGEYGIKDTFCGTMIKIGAGGAEQVYEVAGLRRGEGEDRRGGQEHGGAGSDHLASPRP